MKKFIALILCFCLVFTLCSCGESDPAGSADASGNFNLEYKNLSSGYLTHTSELKSSVMKSDEFECMDDFYIYLPKGTTIASSDNFAVYCYNQHFALDTTLTADCGQTLVRFSPKLCADTRTLSEDCYVRLSVNGKVENVKITVPDGKEGIVITGAKDDLLYGPQINEIQLQLKDKSEFVNYIFITDLHYDKDPTAQKSEALLKQVKAAVKMANTTDSIDFIAIGGDITSGMYETKAESLKYTAEVLEPLKNSKKPVFVLMGNHDDNSYHSFKTHTFDEPEIVSDKDWTDNILKVFCPENIVKDSNHTDSKYYYYDLEGKKTRVICLDSIDYRAKYDENGVIKELPIKDPSKTDEESRYWTGCSYWGYSDEQAKWLATEALSAPADWDYIFVSHMGINWLATGNGYDLFAGDTMRGIVAAFNGRTTYSSGSISVDFSSVSGKVLSYQFGHSHKELTNYGKDMDLWQICTATAQVSDDAAVIGDPKISTDERGNEWVSYDRQYGSDFEACFDIISASDTVIYKYAFGAGTNKTLKYE